MKFIARKIKPVLFICLLLIVYNTGAQDIAQYKKEKFIVNNDTMPYRIFLPLNYDASKKYPLILFLHGSGERGNDNESQLVHGAGLFLQDSVRKKYPAIVVFPQCAKNGYWSNAYRQENETGIKRYTYRPDGQPTASMALLQELLSSILKIYPVNKKQVYIGGLSMGGMGTFEIVRRNPEILQQHFQYAAAQRHLLHQN